MFLLAIRQLPCAPVEAKRGTRNDSNLTGKISSDSGRFTQQTVLFAVLQAVTITLLCALNVMAQSAAARISIRGRVLDQNGAVVSNATVMVLESSAGKAALARPERVTTTDERGGFRFDNLNQGTYRLSASSIGFSETAKEIVASTINNPDLELVLQTTSLAEVVVVSATHLVGTTEAERRIPGSLDIIDAKLLETTRPFTFSEALRKVAGVNVRDEEGFGLRPNIGIRGLNPTRSTKVLLLEDGLPLTYAPYGDNASYYHPPIDRFESIEVLKGSGQILYGPQTVGGVINYITPTPPDKPQGSVTLTGGSRNYFNGHVNYGGTFGSTGVLFNYMRKQGAGARENTRFGLNDFNAKSVTTLGSKQALTLKFNYYGEDSNIAYSGLREDEYQANPRQNPFRNDFFYGDRYGASATHAVVFSSDAILTTNFYGAHFSRDWWRQSSNSGQRPNRLNTLPGGDPDCREMSDLNTTCGNEGRLRKYYFLGVEPRLRINHRLFGFRHETDFGVRAHYETQNRQQQNGDIPTARSGTIIEDNERRNAAYSGFLQNRFLLGDWTITPGFRVEHIEYQRTNRRANNGLGVTGRTDLTQVVPGLGISFNPANRVTIFAGVHRGFAPPRTEDIINNTTGGSIELDPELSWNYEVGARTNLCRGVTLEATFFRMDYANQIVPASLAGGVGSQFTNGGQTLHQGAEASGRVDTGTLFDQRHNFYLRAAYTYLPLAKFVGTRFSAVPGFTRTSITGNRLPYAPAHLLNANLGYSHPQGFDAFIEAVYVGSQFGDDLNTISPTPDGQRGLIPSYTVWNATTNYDFERYNTTLFVTVKNVFDRTYIVDRARGVLPSSPRLIQAGLKFRF